MSRVNSESGWIVYPLEDGSANELVLPKGNLLDLRKLVKSDKELCGLLYGIINQNAIYFMGSTVMGVGERTQVTFDEKYLKGHNEFMRRAKKVHPSLTTIIYHNHPLLRPEEHPSQTLARLKEELRLGVYDYLREYGTTPKLEDAIAELSRQLSPADISATSGRCHVLLTDTARKGDDFSFLNAYKLDPDGVIGSDLFKVVPLSDKPAELHHWAGGKCSSLKRIYDTLKEEFEQKK